MIQSLQTWMESRHPAITACICTLLVCLVGAVDHLTGAELSFSIFYLLPILIISWFGNRWMLTVMGVMCAAMWLIVDVTSGHYYSNRLIPFWNGGVRMAFFLITGNLVSTIKDHLDKEKTLARIDPLTGVLNSRAFFEDGQRFLSLACRAGRPISLAYLDLDNFKTVNDTMGHTEGDRLLREVAATLRESMRTSDFVVRLGGDEFALFLPDTGSENARQAVERVQENIAALASRQNWPISVSVGIVTFKSAPNNLQQVVTMADELMYTVKQSGKGNVIHRIEDKGSVL